MSTSKRIVRYTSEQLRAMSAAGTTGTDWAYVVSHEPDMTDPDSPDISHLIRAATMRLRGRPKGTAQKTATSLRIDKDVLATPCAPRSRRNRTSARSHRRAHGALASRAPAAVRRPAGRSAAVACPTSTRQVPA